MSIHIIHNVLFTLNCTTHSSVLLLCVVQFNVNKTLVHSLFDLVSWLLALEATEPVSEPVTQMTVELTKIHLISVELHSFSCNTINKFRKNV